MIFLRKMKMET